MDELDKLKQLAGITSYKNSYAGSNISITGNEKGMLMKQHDIKPGTDAWFKLWFSKPYLTGETPISNDK